MPRELSQSKLLRTTLEAPRPTRFAFLPVLIAGVLCFPCLSLGYFWDDFYFLTLRGQGDVRAYLFPAHGETFYRPVSQGLYFLLLRLLDPNSGTFAHILNLALLAAAILLLVTLVTKLAGPRAGIISGLALACLGCIPSLIAWVSCCQDLLAIVFMLGAFLLRHQGRSLAALACATTAVLCKEPAIASLPILLFWDQLVGRDAPRSRFRFEVIAYLGVVLTWFLIHPGIRLLASRGFLSGATGYVGLEHPERWGPYLIRYLLTLVNVAPPDFSGTWWNERVLCGLIALPILAFGLLAMDRGSQDRVQAPVDPRRIALLAGLLSIPTLLAPALLIRTWAPYFACMPAVGVAILLGTYLAKQRTGVVLLTLAILLASGVRYRGAHAEVEPAWTEKVFVDASDAAKHVRAGVRKLFPSLPHGSQVLISVGSTGVKGIHSTMIDGQALQAWYRDPTIQTIPILRMQRRSRAQYLVRITPDLGVISIDPESRRVRVASTVPPDLSEVLRPIMSYARAVAASGETDNAVRIAMGLALSDTSRGDRTYYRRMSAAFLLAAGRQWEAERILANTPAFSVNYSRRLVKQLLAEPSESESLDLASFEAFGLSYSDPETIRWIMRELQRVGSLGQAAWVARRLWELDPTDPESTQLIQAARQVGIEPSRMPR